MWTQVEVKFLKVKLDDIRQRLEGSAATLVEPMKLVRSAIMDNHQSDNKRDDSWIRLREGGAHTTLTYKEVLDRQPVAVQRTEVLVNSFDNALELLEKLGLYIRSLQESRREIWRLGEVNVMLDEWPWIKPYIKVVGSSEAAIHDVAARLGFEWSQAIFGDTTLAYAAEYPGIRLELGESIAHMPEVKFGNSLPDWLKERTTA